MVRTIANRPSLEEIEFSKRMGTVHEAERRIIHAGGFSVFQEIIDDPTFLGALLAFAEEYEPTALSYHALLQWLRDNGLKKHLDGGSLEKQVKTQETFYRRFYGEDFRIDRKKMGLLPNSLKNCRQFNGTGEYFCGLIKP